MLLQTARFLYRRYLAAKKGESLPGLTSYLTVLQSDDVLRGAPLAANSSADYRDLDRLLALYRFRALVTVKESCDKLSERLRQGVAFADAFNENATILLEASRAHTYYFLMSKYVETAKQIDDAPTAMVVRQLCAFFGCVNIAEGRYWNGIIDNHQLRLIDDCILQLMKDLRPNAVALVDAFDIPDIVLGSTIGRYDGNVYEALYEAALKATLNKTVPFDGYEEVLQPHLDIDFMKLRNGLTEDAREAREATQQLSKL